MKIGYIVSFAIGAAVGAIVTFKIVKNKYEQMIESEIAQFKQDYYGARDTGDTGNKNAAKETTESETDNQPEEDEDEEEYREYKEIADIYSGNGVDNADRERAPYVISPDDFGTNSDYDTETLTYYADGVLTDDMDNPIENVADMIGSDSLNHIGDYSEDEVHVRNDRNMTDYEILVDPRTFREVWGA